MMTTKQQDQHVAQVAAQIAAMVKDALGDADPSDPASMIVVAVKLRCRVTSYCRQGEATGFYKPSPLGQCLIEYNTAYPEEIQARAICRGISRHVTHFMYSPNSITPVNLDDKRDVSRPASKGLN